MATIGTALLSVSDKTGIIDLASALHRRGVEILSTGGTARLLTDNGVPVTRVSERTGYPEIMDGRVKTLHPVIHGGLLGRRGIDDDVMVEHGIAPIDLLVVNLYPFAATIARDDCTLDIAIENIDIGGPAMVRAAAKNFRHVSVVTDPADYDTIVGAIDEGSISEAFRLRLSQKAFEHVSGYDTMVAGYLAEQLDDAGGMPASYNASFTKRFDLRYGENPHQRAAFYVQENGSGASISNATQLQGKELSYNNIADADAALECVKQFYEPACVIVKHANPCGVAVDETPVAAYKRAYSTDATSAFGGIIAINRALDGELVEAIFTRQFVEVIVAPDVTDSAREMLSAKSNVRVLSTGWWDMAPAPAVHTQKVVGGLLVQDRDLKLVEQSDLKVVTERAPGEHEVRDLLFAWKVCKYVKSNAIVFAKDGMTIGVGAGQMSRVYSTRLAAMKAADAGLAVQASVMASDAFFPFRDGLDGAAEHGVTAVIQPGGSKRDDEVIAAANEHGMAMVFTGMRHFRH